MKLLGNGCPKNFIKLISKAAVFVMAVFLCFYNCGLLSYADDNEVNYEANNEVNNEANNEANNAANNEANNDVNHEINNEANNGSNNGSNNEGVNHDESNSEQASNGNDESGSSNDNLNNDSNNSEENSNNMNHDASENGNQVVDNNAANNPVNNIENSENVAANINAENNGAAVSNNEALGLDSNMENESTSDNSASANFAFDKSKDGVSELLVDAVSANEIIEDKFVDFEITDVSKYAKSPFDFILDPQKLIEATNAAKYNGMTFKPGVNMFFRNTDSEFDYSDYSDKLQIVNKGNTDIYAKVIVRFEGAGRYKLSSNPFFGNSDEYLHIALVDSYGNYVPVDSCGFAILDVTISPDEINNYSLYEFGITGTCNPDADWSKYDGGVNLTVFWFCEGEEIETDIDSLSDNSVSDNSISDNSISSNVADKSASDNAADASVSDNNASNQDLANDRTVDCNSVSSDSASDNSASENSASDNGAELYDSGDTNEAVSDNNLGDGESGSDSGQNNGDDSALNQADNGDGSDDGSNSADNGEGASNGDNGPSNGEDGASNNDGGNNLEPAGDSPADGEVVEEVVVEAAVEIAE